MSEVTNDEQVVFDQAPPAIQKKPSSKNHRVERKPSQEPQIPLIDEVKSKDLTQPVKPQGQVVGNYTLGRDLGKGTFGKVKVGTHNLTGEKVAIKVLEKEKILDVADVERVAREIHILKVVRHPHVVQLYEIIETSKELYLIMEYARGGELFEYIVNRKRVRERDACRFLHQIISGIEYLHKLGICHRDLKPENLLMDEHNNIKIVDFGLSNTYKGSETLKTACGSPCYAAPEMIAGKRYNGLMADIWSCGVILYAMVCGYLPFEDPNTNLLYKKILGAEYTIPTYVSDEGKDIIQKILNTEPQDRFKIDDIRKHPWYKQVNVRDYGGIIVGTHSIPVDEEVIQQLREYEFDLEQTRRMVEGNRHNHVTTTYYLLLKRHIRKGGKSVADLKTYNPQTYEQQIIMQRIQNRSMISELRQSQQRDKTDSTLTQSTNTHQRLRSQEPIKREGDASFTLPSHTPLPTHTLQKTPLQVHTLKDHSNVSTKHAPSPSPHQYFKPSFNLTQENTPQVDLSQRKAMQQNRYRGVSQDPPQIAQQLNTSYNYTNQQQFPSVMHQSQRKGAYNKFQNQQSPMSLQKQQLVTTYGGQGFNQAMEIPFMYFTPRDAIKMQQQQQQQQQQIKNRNQNPINRKTPGTNRIPYQVPQYQGQKQGQSIIRRKIIKSVNQTNNSVNYGTSILDGTQLQYYANEDISQRKNNQTALMKQSLEQPPTGSKLSRDNKNNNTRISQKGIRKESGLNQSFQMNQPPKFDIRTSTQSNFNKFVQRPQGYSNNTSDYEQRQNINVINILQQTICCSHQHDKTPTNPQH